MTDDYEGHTTNPFAEWAIVELMGHRRLAGKLTEQTIAGFGFLRLDIPGDDDKPPATQIFAPSSVYAITPCTEETARLTATVSRVEPVSRWDIPRLTAPEPVVDEARCGFCGCTDDNACFMDEEEMERCSWSHAFDDVFPDAFICTACEAKFGARPAPAEAVGATE